MRDYDEHGNERELNVHSTFFTKEAAESYRRFQGLENSLTEMWADSKVQKWGKKATKILNKKPELTVPELREKFNKSL